MAERFMGPTTTAAMGLIDERTTRRDAGVALALYLLLLGFTRAPFPPARVPGTVLIVGFDAPQHAVLPGLDGVGYPAVFALYLIALAAVGGRIASWLRGRFGAAGPVRYGLVGGLLAIPIGLLAAAVLVVGSTVNPIPAPMIGAAVAGFVGLWAGRRLAAWREPAG